MICSCCYRDVPDLVGPEHEVCPQCYGVSADDFVPSAFAAAEPCVSSHSDFWKEFTSDFREYFEAAEAEGDSCLPDELEFDDEFPTFRGKPRF